MGRVSVVTCRSVGLVVSRSEDPLVVGDGGASICRSVGLRSMCGVTGVNRVRNKEVR